MSIWQTIISPSQSDQRSRKAKFIPSVLAPTPGQLARLDGADRDLLAHVLREPVEYMDCPALHKSDAEKTLAAGQASPPGRTTHFAWVASGRRDSDGVPSAAEERSLFEKFNYARMRRQHLLQEFAQERMPIDKLRLLLAWVYREMELRHRIVELNMPLVLAMVARYHGTVLDRNDLVSEGSLALLRCVDKFDCSRGFKFSTYACRAIIKSCCRVSRTNGRYTSRFPVSYDPTMEHSDVLEFKRLDAKSACLEEVREILAQNRAGLSEREQTVICERFMLGSHQPDSRHPSLTQVGDHIGVTKERVRQIQNMALAKLREALEDSFL